MQLDATHSRMPAPRRRGAERVLRRIHRHVRHARDEEPLRALHVVLLHVGIAELEMHGPAASRAVGIGRRALYEAVSRLASAQGGATSPNRRDGVASPGSQMHIQKNRNETGHALITAYEYP